MIERILPADVASGAVVGSAPVPPLLPGEGAALGPVAGTRHRDFAAGRACARWALLRLGARAEPILPGRDRAPRWPAGLVGSITHCPGYSAAAVAYRRGYAGVGLDAEPHAPLPGALVARVARPEELRWLHRAAGGVHWDRVLWCAKESVYKVWYPLTRRWLGFTDASVRVDVERATFRARILVPGLCLAGRPLAELSGRFLVCDGLVLTAIALPQPRSGPAPAGAQRSGAP